MNAMIRALKGTLAVLALAGLGLLLRWMTAGSISGLRTYDLDTLTVLAVGTVAWIAYGWLALAVVSTVLEQLPGVVGALAGAVAGRITTKTARALLRSGLGVAAVTPLTIGVAHASPGDSSHVLQLDHTEPASTVKLTNTNYRATEPHSTVQLGGTDANTDYRAAEPHSRLEIGGSHTAPQQAADSNYRATEPRSRVQIGGTNTDYRAPEPPSKVRVSESTDSRPATELPTGGRMRMGVPDRPTDGAPTRYTDLRPTMPVRVVVREGDSLWTLAARELGPTATNGAIAARWPDWYAANRQVIGDDPDLIFPGQVLRVPPASTGDHVPPTHQEK
jgi:nucleoid-associated protein YgaU